MVDYLLNLLQIDLTTIVTFADVIPIIIKMFLGIIVLRILFNFFAQIFPTNSRGVFRGL